MHDEPSNARKCATTREEIAELHEFNEWPAKWIWPMLFAIAALSAAAAVALSYSYWPALVVLLPAQSALMFVFVLSFHDASHGRLHPVHFMNEMFGHILGTLMLTPLNVYRFAHARHHAQLSRPADPELWPFNMPSVSRLVRVVAAFSEIVFALVHTPLLFLRSVFVGKLTREERQAVTRGYIAIVAFWAVALAVVIQYPLWKQFLVLIVIPMAISATMQTINKYEQHLGLHGETVLGLTRTVIDRHRFAEMVSAALLYTDYHGTHHRYAKIPYYHLPQATPYTVANAREKCPVFPSLLSATLAMVPHLTDPKAGPQWNAEREQGDFKLGASSPVAPIAQPVYTGSYEHQSP